VEALAVLVAAVRLRAGAVVPLTQHMRRIATVASLVAAVVLALAAPGTAQARTIDPRAVELAVAFWQPYNQGISPCSSVSVTYADLGPGRNGETHIGYPASAFTVGQPMRQPMHRGHTISPAWPCSAGTSVQSSYAGSSGTGAPHLSHARTASAVDPSR
jgi:hypothetical protein